MYGSQVGRARWTAVAVGAALLAAGCSSSDGDGAKPAAQQPKATDPYWVNPEGNAAKQVASYLDDGDDKNAELIRKIAAQPVGEWIGPDNPEDEAKGYTEAAAKADRDALLVLYNIPHRDCGQFSKGAPRTVTRTARGSTRSPRASATAGPRSSWNRTPCCTSWTAAPRPSTTRSGSTC